MNDLRQGRPSRAGLAKKWAALLVFALLSTTASAQAQCSSCAVGSIACGPCKVKCPPWYKHYVEGPARLKFKHGCPRPIADPCQLPYYGYYPTCWRPWSWPADWSHCAVAPPGAMVPPSSGRPVQPSDDVPEPAPEPRQIERLPSKIFKPIEPVATRKTAPAERFPAQPVKPNEPKVAKQPKVDAPAAPKSMEKTGTISLLSSQRNDPSPTRLVPPPPLPATPDVRYVKNRRIIVECNVEELGKIIPGKTQVELWYTRDAKRWYHTKTITRKGPPYEIGVSKDGRYGFTLRARNEGDPKTPDPKAGDAPHLWVEVDTEQPTVELVRAQPSVSEEASMLVIDWQAADKSLRDKPISLAYAKKPEGPWTPIAEKMPNVGTLAWEVPKDVPSQIYLRVTAEDKAGNVGSSQTDKPIMLPMLH